MAATVVTGIEAVVFDLFGTLVYEFPRADWDAWLETSAAILEAGLPWLPSTMAPACPKR